MKITILLMVMGMCCFSNKVLASDHADPISLKVPESGITGLFSFPDDEHMVFILTVRPGLTVEAPYDLEPYTYHLKMDLTSKLNFTDQEDVLRYGGTVVNPEKIKANVEITINLNNQGELADKTITGLNEKEQIEIWTGVKDDPFIFPKFFGTNVIAMVIKVPFSSFPENQRDWIIWATSSKNGKQIDHVGRSNRTMQPRFDLLNTLPPSEHVAAITERHEHPGLAYDLARTILMPLFATRAYDFAPDVMIYTNRRPVGFPNGRRLTDDVADLTCQLGDCLLWELSLGATTEWPRKNTNDKSFKSNFPYLADAWPNKKPKPAPSITTSSKIKLSIIGLFILSLLILPWVLYIRCLKKLKRATS